MPGNQKSTVFIGNLDDRLDERVLYEIMVQAGPLVDFFMPRDKETNRHKGIAFAEYESEDVARYAIRLFSGLVCLYKRAVRFEISGEDKFSSIHSAKGANAYATPRYHETYRERSSKMLPPSCRFSSRSSPYSLPPSNHSPAYTSHGVLENGHKMEKNRHSNSNGNYGRRFENCYSSVSSVGRRVSLVNSSRHAGQ